MRMWRRIIYVAGRPFVRLRNSCRESGNIPKCPFCNSEGNKTEEELVAKIMKRVAANDAASIFLLGNYYNQGLGGVQQDHIKAIEIFTKSAELGCSKAHKNLAIVHHEGGNMKKAKFHFEAAAMAGNEEARCNLGIIEAKTGNTKRALKHLAIAASAGHCKAMFQLRSCFEQGVFSRESIDSTLEAYNNSCAETRSKDRDAYIRTIIERI